MLLPPSLLKYNQLMIESAKTLVQKMGSSSATTTDATPLIEEMTLRTVALAAFGSVSSIHAALMALETAPMSVEALPFGMAQPSQAVERISNQ